MAIGPLFAECAVRSLEAYGPAAKIGRGAAQASLTITDGIPGFREGIIAFRGTERDPRDIAADLRASPVVVGGVTVHRGIYEAFESIMPELAKLPHGRYTATGHSLGGALALLAGVWLQDVRRVVTFGAPRVLDVAGADAMAAEVGLVGAQKCSVYRVVRRGDPVPWLPPLAAGAWLGARYRHVGELLYIDRLGRIRHSPTQLECAYDLAIGPRVDPLAAHSMRGYLEALRGPTA